MLKNRLNLHCTAGFGKIESVERFWSESLGWKHKGYNVIIDLDGLIYWLKDNSAKNGYTTEYTDKCWEFTTNGVYGYNSKGINIATIGGVENVGTKEKPIWKAKDTRTPEQIESLHTVCQEAISYLSENGVDVTKDFGTYGHREYSPDNNGDGIISKWERIKECPSWDVMNSEFHYLYSSIDRYKKLPYEN